ncbi:lipid kinase [Salinisphaera hydrothermalis]|uniref:Lipid kinase n=1 Tax=Salinisphaera hydrothermalis (strain C41B8) TaxID=1304275 RepID=A0A084IJC6_SALHC|nr:lipid kinase [Salinisphaera hydrothermalis]KEZ76810.1 lipid kinase [Salinisphaera hydrothermalis C41B8]
MIRLRALLLINRESRQGEANAQNAVEHLAARDVDVVEGRFDDPDDVPAEIRRHADDVDVVVLGGGDGTLNLASKAMMECGKPMAVLPLGTANDFARTLLIPTDLAAACDNVVDGVDYGIDLGQCNDVYFLNVASIGLAVRACEYRSDTAKKWFGSLGYASNVFSAVRDTEPFSAEVRFNGRRERLQSIQIAVGNGRYFGGGMAVSSDAALDDGRLDLYSLKPQPLSSLIAMLPGLMRGPHKAMQGVQLFESTEFELRTEQPMDINTDGELLTATPATFRVLPRALTVKVPQAYLDRYGSGKSASAA